ncbi:MAG TPA: undecaprenyl-diphosphate phosphatase [Candidatus Saccharimonadia bacterium]|nr:undecaprenyl-diphosphate phosphatase [Candidatus Saccharimonadia bacterium]
MITIFQAIVLGLLQGASELFPVSSLGHSVVLPQLLGWNIRPSDNAFIVFLVATHVATALVLIGFYWRTWLGVVRGLLRSVRQRAIRADDAEAKLGWLLIVGTLPAGLLGLLFERQIRDTFVSARSAALFLMLNGLLLLGAEYLRRRAHSSDSRRPADERIARVGGGQALAVGASQALALIPGLSRSGATMGGGLLAGLSHEDAARFAFLLATPIILAAGVLKLPALARPENHALLGPALVGGLCAALSAYATVKFLTRYFHSGSLRPFGIYCLAAGLLATLAFL